MKKKIILSLLIISKLFSEDNIDFVNIVEGDRKSLTIYEENKASYSFLSDIDIKDGKQNIILKDVPDSIIENSILTNFDKDFEVIYQNILNIYKNVDELLYNNIGERVIYNKSGVEYEGILVSVNPTIVKNEELKQTYVVKNNSDLFINKIDENYDGKIVWKINSEKNINSEYFINYQLSDISWKNNYIFLLKDDMYMDFQSWINIDNKSNKNFKNIDLYISSGNLKNKKEYNLLFVGSDIDINANEKTQVKYIDEGKVKYSKYAYVEFKQGKGDHGTVNLSFEEQIEFTNVRDKGLGFILPEGDISIYEKDKNGIEHLVSENHMKATQKFKNIILKIGKDKKVVGTIKMKKYSMSKNFEKGIEDIEFKNNSNKTKKIKLRIITPKYGKMSSRDSCGGESCSSVTISKNVKEYIIYIKEGGSYSFRRSFEVYY